MKHYIQLISLLFMLQNGFIANAQKQEDIALLPPMGWNSWNCLRLNINESKIKEIADWMVKSGMKDAGYEYVVIDDGWMTDKRDDNGHIIVDPEKFPSGMKDLGDYIHNLGLKFGIYSAPGCFTCQKLMGSLGYEQVDADDYAAWGVDYLKYDWCNYPGTKEQAKNTPEADCRRAYEIMRDCLRETGRPIIYSVHSTCSGKRKNSLPWVKDVAHMHRSSDDIKDNWDRMLYCLDKDNELWQYAGPGFWNDPDMLEVGNKTKERLFGGISDVKMNLLEYQTHFSMWCMVAAPLISGNDLRSMSEEVTEILTNREMIAVDQDLLGTQGRKIKKNGDLEVWSKELSGNKYAVAFLNRSSESANISVSWKELGIKGKYNARDLWKHKHLGKFRNSYTAESVKAHEAVVLLLQE